MSEIKLNYKGPGLKMPMCDRDGCDKTAVHYVTSVECGDYARCEEHDRKMEKP